MTNNLAPAAAPKILILPGIDNSGPTHWQSLWENELENCERVQFGMWNNPHRNTWVNKLNAAITAAGSPVVLVAHSLGCHAVAWWNRLEREPAGKVLGALLVAPPSLFGVGASSSRLSAFGPVVRERLRFPAILAASRDDHYASYAESRKMARLWGCRLVDAGWLGHINAESGIGSWQFGRYLLDRLIANLLPHRSRFDGPAAPAPLRSTELRLAL
ncbi:alpha/beta hydrolase [Leptolyngbya sp. 15MV]|nr:alpha/beta hydrolase [Leptolyngbya sp. 15MV]